MKIVAKANANKDNIIDKIKKGCQNIELHLTEEFFTEDVNFYYKECIKTNSKVYAVHLPLTVGVEINLEYLTYEKYRDMFFKVCKFSQKLAEYYEHEIVVVIHNGFTLQSYELMPPLLKALIDTMNIAITLFPDLSYAIENVIPFSIQQNNKIQLTNGVFNDNVEIVKYLNGFCKKQVFGTVLDTCHALTTMRLMEYVFKNEPQILKDNTYDLDYYFRENKDITKIIHLANTLDMGFKKNQHGSPFFDDDMHILSEIVGFIKKYDYDCLLTIEVFELDYLNSLNFRKTWEDLKLFL